VNAHDANMICLGAVGAELLIAATWWVMGIKDRRKADRALAKAQAAVDRVKQLEERA
jgi:hypothetical protein